jgi:hypothetical protein
MQTQRLIPILILGILLFLFRVNAHIRLICPAPISAEAGLKIGPCGQVPDPGIQPTIIKPGPFPIVMEERYIHEGSPFRLALLSPDAIGRNGNFNPKCSYVLLNHIPNKKVFKGSIQYTIVVEIPDVKCENCALQMIQIMTDKIPANLGSGATNCTYNPLSTDSWDNQQCGSNYHSCSKVTIQGKTEFESVCPANSNIVFASNPGWSFPKSQFEYSVGESGYWDLTGSLSDLNAESSYRTIPLGTECSQAAKQATTDGQANQNPVKINGAISNSLQLVNLLVVVLLLVVVVGLLL